MLGSVEVGDSFTYPFVLKACGKSWLLNMGRPVHCQAVVNGWQGSPPVANSLLGVYGCFGHMETMTRVFHGMAERDLMTLAL
ncbi:hypothetical protein MLD38_009133 [Melastoma candidum]|uniref:Uncharacterized protein n=1 Tax=Melastoma candidum TaxID=119954 RepID=A0ACB9RWI7_9MYRT|nr:hypothetical protein MLD38_009133 [Melastoma candidum]